MTMKRVKRSVPFQGACCLVFLMSSLLGPPMAQASDAEAHAAKLTLDRIFKGEVFQPASVAVRWLPEGDAYTVLEPSAQGQRQVVRYDRDSATGTVLVPAERLVPPGASRPLRVEDYRFSAGDAYLLIFTNSRRVWRRNTRGDYWVLDRASHELRQLGGDVPPSTLMFAKFSPTAPQVAYVRDRNIHVENLLDHSIRQVTRTPTTHIINGTFDWVYEEELSLRDGFRWSPDGRSIAYWQLDTAGVPEFSLVNNTDSLYPAVKRFAYPKVGQQNSACRVGVLDIVTGATRWLDVPGDPRNHYIARIEWIDRETILLQQLNRRQNTNRVMECNARTGKTTILFAEHDEAWVDIHDELFWSKDKTRFTWISERDGWRHVYMINRQGDQTARGQATLITPGNYDVIKLLHLDETRQCIYFLASPDKASQQYLYRIQLDGTGLTRVTPAGETGTFQYRIASDGSAAVVTSSAADRPPRVDLVSLPEHKRTRTLEENVVLRRNFQKLDRVDTEFFRVDIGGGVQLDAWCIRPPKMEANRKYPLLVHVYGEPAGQTVLDRWGGNNYLWHLMLAQRGYVVMSFDNRGTPAPRGRAWRKSVYKKVGILAPQEQAAAVKAVLRQRPYLDPERVGVWGWSGGGSMTLNAMFKFPALYKTGISVAPVPNQRYYDTIYQERYMGLPEDNVDGFLQGSPINFANRLEGNLLLVHGTGDDNCHYQTTEMLINELIRCNKRFSMMSYPNRTHAIREGTNTTRHLRQLMTDYLIDKLPPGPR